MYRSRWQDPPIETRKDVARPYYFIRPYVPLINESGELERKQKPLRLGFCDETSKREAKAIKEQIMSQINAGKSFVQAQIPFSTVLDRFVTVRLPQIPATADSYRNKIEKHIRPAFAKMRMCDIDKCAVEAWLNGKEAEGYSHNTLLDLRKVLSAIFSQAIEWKMFSGENPCWRLGKKIGGKKEVFAPKNPKAEGLQRFLGELRGSSLLSLEAVRLLVLTELASGARPCEALGLQVRDIDAERETMTIERDWTRGRVGPTKTPNSRRTRAIPGLAAELLTLAKGKKADDFVFARADGSGLPPDDRDLQQHVFRPAAERAGIYTPGFGLRRFRGINISWRQQVGAAPLEAQMAAGHTRLSTTWLYTQNEEDRDREHVQKIMERIHGPAAGGVQ